MSPWIRSRRGWLHTKIGLAPVAVLLNLVALACIAPTTAHAFPGAEHKAALDVALDRTAYEPGSTVRVAARVAIDDHWHVNSNTPSYEYLIPTELSFELPDGTSTTHITYPPHKMLGFDFTDEPIAVYDGTVTILAELSLPQDIAAGTLESQAALRYQACDDKQCLPPVTANIPFQLTVGSGGQATNGEWFEQVAANPATDTTTANPVATASESAPPNLAGMLLLAILGGLILNAMPCVLPVLSLKVFALVKSAGQGRSNLIMGTLATTAGIVVSFWALALAAVLAAKAGAAVGWGIQFQQPGFVTFLAVAMVLFALNMWGLFEIPLPQSVAQAAGSSSREGLAGHFASGLFATLMATPCSAPFLGTAIGFALVQSTAVIFAIFTAVGLGLALPYLLLAAFPATAKWLPKPGHWMITFKHLMGFLLLAASVWLFYVLAAQIAPESVAFVQLSVLALALATWLFNHNQGRPTRRRLAAIGIAAATIGSIALAVTAPPAAAGGSSASELIGWVSFDETEATKLAGDGKLVFVDFTADWCLTCKATERLVIETDDVAKAFEQHEVVPMKADWTNRDDRITEIMARYGRAAVPFYLLYRPGQAPHVFGDLLTKDALISALDEARSQVAEVH